MNDVLVKESTARKDKTLQDADLTYETTKIRKNSTIKLELWAAGSICSKSKCIFCTGGNVESFLNHPIRNNNKNSSLLISAEIMSFWRDEYE